MERRNATFTHVFPQLLRQKDIALMRKRSGFVSLMSGSCGCEIDVRIKYKFRMHKKRPEIFLKNL